MSQIKLAPNASGTGIFTIDSPNSNTNRTLSLPDNAGTIITTGSSGQSIPKAALPTGSVLQVVQGTQTTGTSTTSTSYVDTSLSATITPTSSSSKILIIMYGGTTDRIATANEAARFQIIRGASTFVQGGGNWYFSATATDFAAPIGGMSYLDSPATTSATTYKVQLQSRLGGAASFNTNSGGGSIASLILMEIAA